MSGERYVALPVGWTQSLEQARQHAKRNNADWGVYEVGPEVKEPDYTKLHLWLQSQTHRLTLVDFVEREGCCGLAEALKAAGL